MRTRRIALGVAVTGALCMAVYGEAGGVAFAHPTLAPHKTVVTKTVNGKYEFVKSKLTVKVDTKVTWDNKSSAPHTVTFTKGMTLDKTFQPGKKVSFTFTKPGTYSYFCKFHPWMKAKIVVK
jgi:plastocyanin